MTTLVSLLDRGETRLVAPLSVGSLAMLRVEQILVNSDTGGFTKSGGIGAWRDDREPIAIYDVAGLSFETLSKCADVLLDAGQTDIYVRLPDGRSGWFNRLVWQDEPSDSGQRDIEAERTRERLSDVYGRNTRRQERF
jgi:hypothetical protein